MEAAVEALTSNGNQREPSMEEILASIRRIIEDNDAPSQPSPSRPSPSQPAAETARVPVAGRDQDPHPTNKAGSSLDQTWPPMGEEPRGSANLQEAKPGRPSGDVENFRAELRDAPEERGVHNGVGKPDTHARIDTVGDAGEPVDRNLVQRLAEVQTAQPAPEKPRDSASQGGRQAHEEPSDRHVSDGSASSDDVRPSIVSDYAGRKVAAAFGELNEAFEANRRRNLGQVAEEMLRPMLQDWLDDNLPTIVERLVREEIERIARGG